MHYKIIWSDGRLFSKETVKTFEFQIAIKILKKKASNFKVVIMLQMSFINVSCLVYLAIS